MNSNKPSTSTPPHATTNAATTLASFSGIKRERTDDLPSSPQVPGALPLPPPLSAFKGKFFKEAPFPNNNEDVICSPAAKHIKREHLSPQPVPVVLRKRELSPEPSPETPIKRERLSSESDSSEGTASDSPSSNSSSQGGTVHTKKVQQQQWKTDTRNPGVIKNLQDKNAPRLFSIDTDGAQIQPFCFNCKRYGHEKLQCICGWYYWWPEEYLVRYPWIKTKIRVANEMRWQGRWKDYKRMAKKLDEEVEAADKRQRLFSQHRNNQNWNGVRYFGGKCTSVSREDGQKILQAIRRKTPSAPYPSCCPDKHEFSFDCKKLIESLQRQVNQLRFNLTEIRSGSVSPPKPRIFQQ